MNDLISTAVTSFTKFINENDKKIKEINSGNVLVSYAIALTDFPSHTIINHLTKHYERSFYFEKPIDNFRIMGMDDVLTIAENGVGRFAITDKKIKEWKNSFFNNWSTIPYQRIPLFLGGMKFTTEHNDEDWQDFNDSTWFVPEIIILEIEQKPYLFFNFIAQNAFKDQAIKKFRIKLEKLFSLIDQNESSQPFKILKSEGDSPKDKKKWKQLVSEGLEKISEHEIQKIVFSRKVELHLSNEPDFKIIIDRLKSNYPDCYSFIYHHGKSTFFGASPEKLAKFSNGNVEIDALAGSAPRGSSPGEDSDFEQKLLNDRKNLNEHNFVVDHIESAITNSTLDMELEKHFSIKKLANIQHIWSRIVAKLSPNSSMINLLKELYPTPAICGYPKDDALHMIKKMEGYKRGLYAGIIGWFNLNDEGEFAVAIRSALLSNNKLIAFAGCGIVEDSDPEVEFKETELKLKPIMSLFRNENKN